LRRSIPRAQQANQSNIAGANQQYQTNQNAALAGLGTTLGTEMNNYQTAAQGVAGQAYANALKNINLYQLTSPTATSGSGALDNRYIAAYANINLPLQQQLAQMQIGTTNQLYGLGSNLQNQYLGNLQSQYAGQGALNSDLATRSTSANQYLTGLDQNTAQNIQALQQQVATMQPQVALQYLQAMGVPLQTAQQIISGNTQNLSQLTGLDQQANAYNFVSPYSYQGPSYASPRVSAPGLSGNNLTGTNGVGGGLDNTLSGMLGQQNNYLQAAQGGQPLVGLPQGAASATATANNYQSGNPVQQANGSWTGGYGPNSNFTYNPQADIYTDPAGNAYTNSGGQWYPASDDN
jgi:hypothetical protein